MQPIEVNYNLVLSRLDCIKISLLIILYLMLYLGYLNL